MYGKKSSNASGTGYGGSATGDWKERKQGQKLAARKEQQSFKEWRDQLLKFVSQNKSTAVARKFDASPILDTVKKVLRCQAPGWWHKQPQRNMYIAALQVSAMLIRNDPNALGNPDEEDSTISALHDLSQTSKLLLKQLKDSPASARENETTGLAAIEKWLESQSKKKSNCDEKDVSLAPIVLSTRDLAFKAVTSILETPELSMVGSHDYYRETMKPLAFDTIESFNAPKHYYKQNPNMPKMSYYHKKQKSSNSKNQYGSLARSTALWKEISTYPTSLPIEYGSSVFVRALEEEMDKLRVLITGPEDTPYANGCFLFDIHMGNDYPRGPPKVHFLTTKSFLVMKQAVRFNPNLYADGKVCLSLLGTWSGPGWKAGESTLLQVLVSIQSLILGTSDPWCNEPGYDIQSRYGQQQSANYNKKIRRQTLEVAILPFLKHHLKDCQQTRTAATNASSNLKTPHGTHPVAPNGNNTRYYQEFESVIQKHFRLKRAAMQQQLRAWLHEDPTLSGLCEEFARVWREIDEAAELKVGIRASTRNRRARAHTMSALSQDGVIRLDGVVDLVGAEPRRAKPVQSILAKQTSTNSGIIELCDSDDNPSANKRPCDDIVDLT